MTVCMTALESAEERRLFEDVYRAYCGRMLALARRRLSTQADAEDAVQQSFLALAERFDPAMADGLAQQILGADAKAQAPAAGKAKAGMPGEGAGTEAKTVKDAREQSQKSTQPD